VSRSHAHFTQYAPAYATSKLFFAFKIVTYCVIKTLLVTLYYFTTQPQLNDAPFTTSTTSISITFIDHIDNEIEQVLTGTSTAPFFPKTIWLPRAGSNTKKSAALPAGIGSPDSEEQYHLLGLGIRKVSFLGIQVYVVGIYVALSDMSKLQDAMVHSVAGDSASTLVSGEKGELRRVLLNEDGSEEMWEAVWRDGRLKSAVRIVPTRSTDFGHLRDGWIRGIDARGKRRGFEDEEFKTAVDKFKGVFEGRMGVGKGKVLLLGRGENGGLGVWLEGQGMGEGKAEQMVRLGGVRDERVGRLVWLGYLAGKNVASEEARKSVIEGVMEIVERPIGTVETQVV